MIILEYEAKQIIVFICNRTGDQSFGGKNSSHFSSNIFFMLRPALPTCSVHQHMGVSVYHMMSHDVT